MIRALHADAILLGDGTAIRDGVVVLEGDVVRAVGPAASSGDLKRERLSGVLMPGLINAHTHLELSGLRGKTKTGSGFVPWVTALQNARVEELEEERDAAIDRALASMQEAGVVAVGEVTNTLVACPRLARRFLGTVFHEIFSMDAARGMQAIAAAERLRDEMMPVTENMRWTLAPHALYSTHPDVVRAIAERAELLSFHLAEHAAERAFLEGRGGPLLAFFASRGAPVDAFPVPKLDPITYAGSLGLLRKGASVVHLADAKGEELDRVAASGAIAILCPRSNLAIETRLPPLLALRARGVPIALGTDSLASSSSLDPLAEARALLDRTPEVPAATLIAAATSVAADAIGWPDLGRIAVGTAPGLLHVAGALPADADPSAWVLRSLSLPRRMLTAARGTA